MEIKLQKIDENRWLIPKTGQMRVPGLIFSNSKLLKEVQRDESLVQVANVATLPGIVQYSLAMPDIHWGYGFPIGGVAAFHMDEGIVSPGGVGYDINCGCRLMTTSLKASEPNKSGTNFTLRLTYFDNKEACFSRLKKFSLPGRPW